MARRPGLYLALALPLVLSACPGKFSAGSSLADGGGPVRSDDRDATDAGLDQIRDGDRDAGEPEVVQVGPVDVSARGPLVVATTLSRLLLAGESRPSGVRLWYPGEKGAKTRAEQAQPSTALESDQQARQLLSSLFETASPECITREMHAAIDAKAMPNAESWPLVLFVPCEGCPSYSSFSVAEHLASWGIVVAALDTPAWLSTDTSVGPASSEQGKRLVALLDALFEAPAASLPSGLGGKLDAERVGIWGHGQGATLAANALATDARAHAWVLIAPTLASADPQPFEVGDGTARSLFVLAREDNVVPEVGNIAVRTSFEEAKAESWLLEVSDAGHYSFSDFAGLTTNLSAGCGNGSRQSSEGPFTYLDREVAVALTQAYVLAYFARELLGDDIAREYLKAPRPKGVVTLAHHD